MKPWILFATQFGTLVLMPGDDDPEDYAENEFFQGWPPLSSSTSEASTGSSTPREHARYGFGGDRIDEVAHPGWDPVSFSLFWQSAEDRVLASEGSGRPGADVGADSDCCDDGTHVCFRPVSVSG